MECALKKQTLSQEVVLYRAEISLCLAWGCAWALGSHHCLGSNPRPVTCVILDNDLEGRTGKGISNTAWYVGGNLQVIKSVLPVTTVAQESWEAGLS